MHGGRKARETSLAKGLAARWSMPIPFEMKQKGNCMQTLSKMLSITALAASLFAGSLSAGHTAPKKEFKVAWSIYVGWMPWGYASDHGIVKKWADKYGIKIDVTQFNDYVESMNQFTAGAPERPDGRTLLPPCQPPGGQC